MEFFNLRLPVLATIVSLLPTIINALGCPCEDFEIKAFNGNMIGNCRTTDMTGNHFCYLFKGCTNCEGASKTFPGFCKNYSNCRSISAITEGLIRDYSKETQAFIRNFKAASESLQLDNFSFANVRSYTKHFQKLFQKFNAATQVMLRKYAKKEAFQRHMETRNNFLEEYDQTSESDMYQTFGLQTLQEERGTQEQGLDTQPEQNAKTQPDEDLETQTEQDDFNDFHPIQPNNHTDFVEMVGEDLAEEEEGSGSGEYQLMEGSGSNHAYDLIQSLELNNVEGSGSESEVFE